MYRKTIANEIPRATRNYKSAFEDTQEWQMMKKDLHAGLKRGEALEIALSPKDMERIGLLQRNIARWVSSYLQKNGLEKYKVLNFKRDGLVYIVVKYPLESKALVKAKKTA